MEFSPATEVVRLGRPAATGGAGVNPPVMMNATYHQGDGPTDLVYGRDGNETWSAFEEVLGGLEGGSCLVFASGWAAIAAVLETLPVPGRVVVPGDAYGGTRRFLTDVAGRGRLRFRTVDVADTAGVLSACSEFVEAPGRPSGSREEFGAGGILWIESPTNPLLAVADLAALIEGAHDLGMDVVVDNTFATPLLQQPLALGADVVVHSVTKLLSGHSDVVMGAAVTRRADVLEQLVVRRSLHGAIAGPWETWVALRGLRTLALRVERAGSNALTLATRLCDHPRAENVRYPGLPSDPGHDRAARQMKGFGSVVAFEVVGPAGGSSDSYGSGGSGGPDVAASAEAVLARLKIMTVGTSLGGVETLIERRGRWEAEQYLPPGLVRMSVGIEDVEDLWRDLDQALSG